MISPEARRRKWTVILTGIPVTTLQCFSIIIWIVRGIWWPFVVWALVAAIWGTLVSRYYFNHVKCGAGGLGGFCVEVWGG